MDRDMTIKIKYLHGVDPIVQANDGELYDLRAAEDVVLKKGELKYIHLGICAEMPLGFEAHMYARSSTAKNFGIMLAGGVGIIDHKFCGDNDEWCFPAFAIRDTVIHKNDRIAQFRIIYQQPACEIKVVDVLGNVSRGGLGSTGKR
jgi:dUTP pyrophosphatase